MSKRSYLLVLTLWLGISAHGQYVQNGSKLVGSGSAGGEQLGMSIALSADSSTLIAGAPGLMTSSTRGGAVIYTRQDTDWIQQAILVPTGITGYESTGAAVAISSDGNTAVVGGFMDNDSAGAAWIFVRSGTTWTQQAKLTDNTVTSNAWLGYSIAMSGDGNTCVLGAPMDKDTVGAAVIFVRTGTTWSRQAKLTGTSWIGQPHQASTVTMSYDGNTAAISGIMDNGGVGAAWVFKRTGTVWAQDGGKLNVTFVGNNWYPYPSKWEMGLALSGDGLTLAAGNQQSANRGGVHIFLKQGSSWQHTQVVASTNYGSFGQGGMGDFVSLSYNGNVLAFIERSDQSQNGVGLSRTYVFTRTSFTGTYTEKLNASYFPDYKGITKFNAIATSANGGLVLFGSVYDKNYHGCVAQIRNSQNNYYVTAHPTRYTGSPGNSGQGYALASSADGKTILTAGLFDNGQGSVWAFKKNGNSWQQYGNKCNRYDNVYGNTFGYGLALSADARTAMVSCEGLSYYFYVSPTSAYQLKDSGGSYVLSGDSINTMPRLYSGGNYYGGPVALSGDGATAMVGMPGDSANLGSVSTYVQSGGHWVQLGQKVVIPAAHNLGYTLALSAHGDVAVAGTQDTLQYVLRRTGSQWQTEAVLHCKQPYTTIHPVAISADGLTVAVGDFRDSIGAVGIYTYTGGTWTLQARIRPNDITYRLAEFGYSLSLSADGNVLAAGADQDNDGPGAFWAFRRNGNSWHQLGTKMAPYDTAGATYVGSAISMASDGNTIFVGGRMDYWGRGATWVYDYTGLRIITDSVTANRCNNSSGGRIAVHAAGGTAPYHYHWSVSGAADADTISHLAPGSYYLTMTDAAGDTVSGMYEIPVRSGINVAQSSQKACGSTPSGMIALHVSGGATPYQYSWNTTPTQSDSIATNLSAGLYSYTVTDASNCQVTGSALLVGENVVANVSGIAAACNGTNGSATIHLSGGTAPYQYLWSSTPAQTDSTASHLATGIYTYTATDAIHCQVTGSHTVGFVPLHVSGYATEANCHTNTGRILLYTYAGTAPYTYHWSNNSTQNPATNLHTGSYTVTVTDSLQCHATASFTVDSFCLGVIEGTVFGDINSNCLPETGEPRLSAVVTAEMNGYQFFSNTDANGNYQILVPQTGAYDVSVNLNNTQLCSNPHQTVSIPALGDTISDIDFGTQNATCFDAIVHPGWSPMDTARIKTFWIFGFSNGISPGASDTVRFVMDYDPAMVYLPDSTALPMPVADTINHILTVNAPYSSVPSFEFYIPTGIGAGAVLHNCFSLVLPIMDCDTTNNRICYDDPFTSSHDPNYKTCSPDSIVHTGDSILTYTVHFQNNGNDTARFIIVKDTLSPYVDPASVRTIANSHTPYRLDISQFGILQWIFDPIALPDSATDPIGSQGFIVYTVKVRRNISPGTIISNRADIFFDYNDPVATNTHHNMIAYPLSIAQPGDKEYISVTAIPNPFSDYVTFRISGVTGKYDLTILDVTGKVVTRYEGLTSETIRYDRGNMAAGVYLYKVTDHKHNESIGKLVIE